MSLRLSLDHAHVELNKLIALLRYFYWRLRRRLEEEAASKRLAIADPSLSRKARMAIIASTISSVQDVKNDQEVTLALEQSLAAIDLKVKESRASSISATVEKMSEEDHLAVVDGLKRALGEKLSGDDLAVSLIDLFFRIPR